MGDGYGRGLPSWMAGGTATPADKKALKAAEEQAVLDYCRALEYGPSKPGVEAACCTYAQSPQGDSVWISRKDARNSVIAIEALLEVADSLGIDTDTQDAAKETLSRLREQLEDEEKKISKNQTVQKLYRANPLTVYDSYGNRVCIAENAYYAKIIANALDLYEANR